MRLTVGSQNFHAVVCTCLKVSQLVQGDNRNLLITVAIKHLICCYECG